MIVYCHAKDCCHNIDGECDKASILIEKNQLCESYDYQVESVGHE